MAGTFEMGGHNRGVKMAQSKVH